MAYSKIYQRINWKNVSEAKATPIGATNLNKIDYALNEIDSRVVELETSKMEKSELLNVVSEWTMDEQTGIISITKLNGEKILFDLNIEKIPVNFSMSEDGILVMKTEDGTEYTANIGEMIPILTFNNSDTIMVSTSGTGKDKTYTFDIKDGSITQEKLQPNYLAEVKVAVESAGLSAESASESAKESKTSETNSKTSETAAKTSETNAKASETKASEYANTATSKANAASTSATEAASSASTATEKASDASASAITAANNAATATNKANAAANSASAAENSANSASDSATEASESAENAKKYRDEAEIFKNEAEAVSRVEIMTVDKAGIGKPDGTSITVDTDGTLHAVGGGESGTDNYNDLSNKPSINGVTLQGNKTLASLGIQPAGSYLTEETDPTVPSWAKSPSKPTYTASEVGADAAGSSSTALSDAKAYTDTKIANLVGGAPSTLDTLKEISDALAESGETVEAINQAIGNKLGKTDDSKDNTVTFTQASTRVNISSTEKHSTLFGKIAKWFSDLKAVAFSGSYNDLSNKPSIAGVALSGDKSLHELGITPGNIDADPLGSAEDALAIAKDYTDSEILKVEAKILETATSFQEIMENPSSKNAGAEGVQYGFNVHLGGFTPVIDSTGKITGYKTKAGADTVFPFSSGGKFAGLNVIMSTNGSATRPFSYATNNDADNEYYGNYVTGNTSNNATLTFNKSGKYKLLFRTAYRTTQSNCTLKHNSTTIVTDTGNTAATEYEITASVGDTISLTVANQTTGYGFQCAEVIVYVA